MRENERSTTRLHRSRLGGLRRSESRAHHQSSYGLCELLAQDYRIAAQYVQAMLCKTALNIVRRVTVTATGLDDIGR